MVHSTKSLVYKTGRSFRHWLPGLPRMKRHLRRGPAPIFPALRFALALVGIALWQIGGTASLAAQEAAKTNLNPQDGLTYVWIGPGNFVMGCSKGDDNCLDDEDPAHTVTITKGFWIGQTEVPQGAYEKVAGKNPSRTKGPKLPMESVSWPDARSYCVSVGMRLPTEAEWEYAARAGSTASRYGELDQIAWFARNSGAKTHEVATKQPNAWGLYDTLGNVWEWVFDWFAPYTADAATDPRGPATGQFRVRRGGAVGSLAGLLRVSLRGGNVGAVIGFRCAGT